MINGCEIKLFNILVMILCAFELSPGKEQRVSGLGQGHRLGQGIHAACIALLIGGAGGIAPDITFAGNGSVAYCPTSAGGIGHERVKIAIRIRHNRVR
jgi:hypothetical protein